MSGSLWAYSAFRLSDPQRIVIDLHAAGSIGKTVARGIQPEAARHADASLGLNSTKAVAPETQPRSRELSASERNSLKSLPEIGDPIVRWGKAIQQGPLE
jgi:hypothetical protein